MEKLPAPTVRAVGAVAVAGSLAVRVRWQRGLLLDLLALVVILAVALVILEWAPRRIARRGGLLLAPRWWLLLTASLGTVLVLVIPIQRPAVLRALEVPAFLCDVLAVGTVAMLLTGWAVVAEHRGGTSRGVELGVLAGCVCALTWAMVLATKWPAVMTPDSVDQWKQIHGAGFSDHHPLIHTLWEWLITRLWDSPAAIAVAQSLWLAVVVGWVVSELAEWGVPAWALVVLGLANALSPVNTAYVVTLWKDVPYGVAMLGLVVAMLRILRTQGRCLTSRAFLVAFVGLAVCTATFRHNGPPVTAAVLLTLPFVAREAGRRAIGRAIGLTLVIYLILVLAVPRLLGVRRGASELITQVQIHQIGAAVAAGVLPADVGEAAKLETLLPLRDWRESYNCFFSDNLYYNAKLNLSLALSDRSPVPSLWRLAVRRSPGTLLRHQLCVASMVWRVTPDPSGYIYLFQRNTVPNDQRLSTRNDLPALEKLIWEYRQFTARSDLVTFFWRPAFYLYVTLWGVVVVALRRRDPALLVLAAPSLVQSAVLFLGNVVQDARYQYPVYLIGLALPALILLPRRESKEAARSELLGDAPRPSGTFP